MLLPPPPLLAVVVLLLLAQQRLVCGTPSSATSQPASGGGAAAAINVWPMVTGRISGVSHRLRHAPAAGGRARGGAIAALPPQLSAGFAVTCGSKHCPSAATLRWYYEQPLARLPFHRRCLSPSLLKHLPKVEGGAAEWQNSRRRLGTRRGSGALHRQPDGQLPAHSPR